MHVQRVERGKVVEIYRRYTSFLVFRYIVPDFAGNAAAAVVAAAVVVIAGDIAVHIDVDTDSVSESDQMRQEDE